MSDAAPKPLVAGAALVAVAFWSLKPIFVALIGDRASYLEVFLAAGVISVAASAIAAAAMWRRTLALVRSRAVSGLRDAMISGLFLAVWYYGFYRALYNSQKVDATIIAFTWPLIAVFAMRAILPDHGRRLSTTELALIAIAFLGAIAIGLGRMSITGLSSNYEIAFAFLAALGSGLYLPFAIRAIDTFSGPLQGRVRATFYAISLSNVTSLTCVLLWIALTGERLHFYAFDAEVILICGMIGIGTYLLAEMTWTWAFAEYRSPTLSSLAYFSPAFSVVLLFTLFDVPVTNVSAYGLLLILFSNMSLHGSYTVSNAVVSAMIGTLYVALCSIFVEPVNEAFLTDFLYFMSGLFAILAGFILSRVSNRRSQEMSERTAAVRSILELRGQEGRTDDAVDAMLRAMVDVEFGRGPQSKYDAAKEVRATLRGPNDEAATRARARFDAWFSTHLDQLSLGEKAALWITGGSSILFFMLVRGEGVLSNLGLFAFSAGCLLVIFTIFDYERNNLQGFRNQMHRMQEGFQELGREPYVPSALAATREIRMLRDTPRVRFVNENGELVSQKVVPSRGIGFDVLYWISALSLVGSLILLPLSTSHSGRTELERILRPDTELASGAVLLERNVGVTIGTFDWDASRVAAEIIAQVLADTEGLETATSEVGLDEIFREMASSDGAVDVHPDFWTQNQPNNYRRYIVDEASVRLNDTPYYGWQGIYLPADVAEELTLDEVVDLGDPSVATAFDEDGDGRGEIWIGARGWKSTERTREFLSARGLDRLWDAEVYSDTIFKAKLRRFMAEQRPIIFYGYEPDWIHAAYDLRRLNEGAPSGENRLEPGDCLGVVGEELAVQECPFPPVAVHVAFAARLAEEYPRVAELLANVSFGGADVSGWLERTADRGASPEVVARDWIAQNADRVSAWAAHAQ